MPPIPVRLMEKAHKVTTYEYIDYEGIGRLPRHRAIHSHRIVPARRFADCHFALVIPLISERQACRRRIGRCHGELPIMPPEEITPKTFLHVGCGSNSKEHTTAAFAGSGWRELRLDIDAAVNPDIIGTMTSMVAVADQSVDAIFSSHNIEHLYPH